MIVQGISRLDFIAKVNEFWILQVGCQVKKLRFPERHPKEKTESMSHAVPMGEKERKVLSLSPKVS